MPDQYERCASNGAVVDVEGSHRRVETPTQQLQESQGPHRSKDRKKALKGRHAAEVPNGEWTSCSNCSRHQKASGGGSLRPFVVRLAAFLVVLLLAEPVATWHAFHGNNMMPDVEDTTLHSDVLLPLGPLDICTAAATSLNKALRVCDGYPCFLSCAAAWNSALRDAKRAIGMKCQILERILVANLNVPGSDLEYLKVVVQDGIVSKGEWQNMRDWCDHGTQCGPPTQAHHLPSDFSPLVNPCFDTEGQCRDAASRLMQATECVQLNPPAAICPDINFKLSAGVTNCTGPTCIKSLSWLSFQEYQKVGLGCAGGLKELADEEYKTWACVHETSCKKLKDNKDYACFKYSHVRGEFHYWGLNSVLLVVPPRTWLNFSFCFEDGTATLKNARNGTLIDLSKVTFLFSREVTSGTLIKDKAGFAPGLGSNGCGIFQLKERSKYLVQIDAGEFYYKVLQGWSVTCALLV